MHPKKHDATIHIDSFAYSGRWLQLQPSLKKTTLRSGFFCHFFKEKLAFFLGFDIIYTCLVASVTAPSEGQQTRAETLARVPESGLPREAG